MDKQINYQLASGLAIESRNITLDSNANYTCELWGEQGLLMIDAAFAPADAPFSLSQTEIDALSAPVVEVPAAV